ncbi:V-type immunoglobulin domain-containing suppressor of T-cell activation [Tiliqua scincoides]|uniref:V-type immunoglobulin domain-containing suppressor of T-cell activation n=1 Tax=Tiliqua scincoides TaxID=71010 RepID=UPI003461DCE3
MELPRRHGMEHAAKRRLLLLVPLTLALAPCPVQSTSFVITTPYSLYICPEGQNVTLTCKLSGSFMNQHDLLSKFWTFGNQGDLHCSQRKHIRNVTDRKVHHEAAGGRNTTSRQQASHHGVEMWSDHHGTFHATLANLTLQDSGTYCCYMVEVKKEHNKPHLQQEAHGFMELRIQKANGSLPNCTFHHSSASTENENITAAALATGACIVGILCLPFILLLIYKQRQAINNRRAHELVRMESNAEGIENPVFDAFPAANLEPKPRPQLAYMASRQPSESGRHLLSEPNTPLSPPGPGECFFPSLEPVPDSPNFMNV